MKVSAIVSAYYAEQYLEARLKNLVRQEVDGGHEIIVVCQRESAEFKILKDWVSSDGNVPVFPFYTDDIPTVYAAWNFAIAQASGEYLTNCNSDDILYPGALQTLSKALDEHKAYSVSYFDWDRVEENKEEPFGQFVFSEGGLDKLLEGCFLGPGPMWRKSLHDKHGLFDPEFHSAGDYEFWLKLAYNGEKFYHVRGEPLGSHLEREDGVEHRSPVRTQWETARARARYRKEKA